MNKKFFGLLLTGFILLFFTSVGQNTNYPVKKVKGIDYYVYTVQPSEGLLAVGRKFEVSADEISKINPDTKDGLKVGQELLIPISKKAKLINTADYIQHKVEKKQTLFAISNKYKVSQESIEKLNPDVKAGLREGMMLNIPDSAKIKKQKAAEKKKLSNTELGTQNTKQSTSKYTIHTVKESETLFSISKQYNVDIKDIIKLNPGSDQRISVDSELKIPTKQVASKSTAQHKETVENNVKPSKEIRKPALFQYTETRHIRIAFLLPFMLDQVKKEPALERFQNFYAGALMAIQAAKEKGISFEVYTYDTDKSEEKITEVLNNPELKTMDVIIGPAFSNQVTYVASFAKENKINTLIPFTSKVPDIENNPYLFQFNPGSDAELKYLLEQLNGKLRNMHVVFAKIQGINPLDEGKIRAETLKSELISKRKSIGTIELSSPDNADFAAHLKKSEKNLVIFNTDKYSSVSPYINSLVTASNDYNVVLLEQYSWRNQLERKPDCLYISPFIAEMNDNAITEFDAQFYRFFGKDVSSDSPRYDLLGYDLTNYFVTYINRFGSKFGTKIGSINSIPGIQSQPLFERITGESGYINQRVYSGETKAQ